MADILEAHCADGHKAARVAAALVDADRSGHSSHGVHLLPYYLGQIRDGVLLPDADPVVLEERSALVTVDGRRGFGHLVAAEATDLALAGARRCGVCAVAVRNANHVGRLGAYTERVADEGMVGILLVNNQGGDLQVAPFGAVDRRLTNNPISLAAPGPTVLDMALSVAAEGRVYQAHERGDPLPPGWILDAGGSPSREPADYLTGGSLLPVGGHKGFGLIVLVELIVGLLTGGGMVGPTERPFSNAFVLVCIDPGEQARDDYLREFPSLVDWVKSARRLPGNAEILLPGEPEARRRAASESVDLDAPTLAALLELTQDADVEAPEL